MPINGWNEYKKLFLNEMKENSTRFSDITSSIGRVEDKIILLTIEVEKLKIKATIVGGIAGMVGTTIMTALISLWR